MGVEEHSRYSIGWSPESFNISDTSLDVVAIGGDVIEVCHLLNVSVSDLQSNRSSRLSNPTPLPAGCSRSAAMAVI
jgi:hypothetical protein